MEGLDREQEPCMNAAIGPIASADLDDGGTPVRHMAPDGPALVPDADDVTAAKWRIGHARRSAGTVPAPRPTTYGECRCKHREFCTRRPAGRVQERGTWAA